MKCNGVDWKRMEFNGIEWSVMEFDGVEWNRMEVPLWNQMESNGSERIRVALHSVIEFLSHWNYDKFFIKILYLLYALQFDSAFKLKVSVLSEPA